MRPVAALMMAISSALPVTLAAQSTTFQAERGPYRIGRLGPAAGVQ